MQDNSWPGIVSDLFAAIFTGDWRGIIPGLEPTAKVPYTKPEQ